MKIKTLILPLLCLCYMGCNRDVSDPANGGSGADTTVKNAIDSKLVYFDSLVFSAHNYGDENQYFSTTDTYFKTPRSRYDIESPHMENIDIVYIHDYDYDKPGFMDPVTASKKWYWDGPIYYFPWLSASVQTIFYTTDLKREDFLAAKAKASLLDVYFADQRYFVPAQQTIFPEGTIVGGRSYTLKRGQVIGFKTVKTGKRGLLCIRNDQDGGWPDFAVSGFRTRVDILKEK